MIRTEILDRTYRVFTYQAVDRVPDCEFGYWPQTIRRWLREGLPLELTPAEQNQMFCGKLDRFFDFERDGVAIPGRCGMVPAFPEEILERKPDGAIVMRGTDGIVAERYGNESDESSIPHFLRFPVETPDDWARLKEQRYRLDDPERGIAEAHLQKARTAVADGHMIQVGFTGFYGQLRHWMGTENLSYAFYDFPDMIHDMVEHWSEMCLNVIRRIPADIPLDYVSWWEDMAGRNGPLVSPAVFREFLQPGYHKVMQAAKAKGCELGIVDCDGNPHDIVANWLEEGVNIMFPLEVGAGVDPFAWRREFGRAVRFRGGIDKRALAVDRAAIDAELARLAPLLEDGGIIPHLDHLVPPDVPYENYVYYLDRKRRLIGR